ncbi:rhomboid family intramembrane serine protease [Balneolales bacterium ANBcel1]|nr:rhomboid family intramembrane serine protease [Balneolales bacterium ANBcel1]
MYGDSFGTALKRGYLGLPVALRTILAINVAVFLLQMVLIAFGGSSIAVGITRVFGFIPEWGISLTQPWRLITYLFLHGSILHLAFNMLWLWWMGRPVEQQLGSRNFLVIYFGSGIGGALINLVLNPIFGTTLTIGASGAVFGMMVAFAMLFPRIPIMLLFLPPIEARFVVAGLIAIDLLLISSASDNVARIVHLGGAFWGYVLVKLYFRGYNYDLWVEQLKQRFRTKTRPKPKSRPVTSTQNRGRMHIVTDAEIVEEHNQDELDRILDKISKSGYEGLTAEEKRLLFELSKKK